MSFSVFYAVRFSPAPELGEWLNVAVVGEAITERKAGIVVTDSMDRIEAAFGQEAVERVAAICSDLTSLVAAMVSAHERGEETKPIQTAMRDQALSLSFSEQIVVFEGKFEDALASIASKYLTWLAEANENVRQAESQASAQETPKKTTEPDLGHVANSIHHGIARLSREIFPAALVKSLEQGQKALESIVYGDDSSTILVIGGAGHLGSALLPKLLENGKSVRLFDPAVNGPAVVEILHPSKVKGISIAEVAKRAGVSPDSVNNVLHGATERLRVTPKTAERIRDIASRFGYRVEDRSLPRLHSEDVAASMEGVDVVVYIAGEADSEKERGWACAQTAKALGAHRFIFVSPNRHNDTGEADFAEELQKHSDDRFSITVLRLGELFGHGNAAQWFGDIYDASGRLRSEPSVNVLTAQAVLNGVMSVDDSAPRAFLHVEDAAESILAVLASPLQATNGQIYYVGSESQIRTLAEITRLIQAQVPNADAVIGKTTPEAIKREFLFDKIADELGITPSLTVEDGIAQLVAAFQEGRVAGFLSLRAADPHASQPADLAPEIDWEGLARASANAASDQAASDQSIQKH